MSLCQQTLKRSTPWLHGEALDLAVTAAIRCHPGAADTGLVFVRSDLPGAPEVACLPENVRSSQRWTSVATGEATVHHTEHVLAAIAGLGLDNVRLELKSDRVPVMVGGSVREFVDGLVAAGVSRLDTPREVYGLRRSFVVESPLSGDPAMGPLTLARKRSIVGVPSEELSVQYVYQAYQTERELVGMAEWDGRPETFVGPFSTARSYYLESETKQIEALLNPLLKDLIRLGPEAPQGDVSEVARHKLVDFVGDLAILGRRVKATFVATRSGHALHHDLVRRLIADDLLERRRLE